jgi:HSP20 family protein
MAALVPRRFTDLADWIDGEWLLSQGRMIKMEDRVTENEYQISAELPGMDPAKDIQVNVEGDTLSIHAERRTEQKAKAHSEFYYGSMDRAVRLPANADAEHIMATYDNGILNINVPLKAPQPSGRKIEIASTKEVGAAE